MDVEIQASVDLANVQWDDGDDDEDLDYLPGGGGY